MPQFARFADIIFCLRLTDGVEKSNPMKKGGEHDFAEAGFPFGSDTGGSGCDARFRAIGGAHGWVSQ
jgi:hypothetical protein